MSVTTEPERLGPRITLFDHAMRLHRQHPDGFLPRDGEPYPDAYSPPSAKRDRRLLGADVAAVLDRHFIRPGAHPSELADAFPGVDVPTHRNEHIAAAALRADRQRVRQTGRWLVRHSTDRGAAIVGLALLATDHNDADIPLIQTIGLLSDWFGPLAAEALQRRRRGAEALMWLADRVAGWGRVYVVEALCQAAASSVRPWLLRHACDGDYLSGYFAGKVATVTHLHEAIIGADIDDQLVDHTGRLLAILGDCSGMGTTLEHYPPAAIVLAAHADHLTRQTPTADRYVYAAVIADKLAAKPPSRSGCDADQRDRIVRQYLAVLEQPGWREAARTGLGRTDEFSAWFAGNVAARLHLTAFTDSKGDK